jgi:hypothetical protein
MKFTSVPFAFQSSNAPRQFDHVDICSVVVCREPNCKPRRRFVNVLIPSVLSSKKDDGMLALNTDILNICETCHFCAYLDKATANLSMGVWFLGENGELEPHYEEPFTGSLSPNLENLPDVLMLRGYNFYHQSMEERNFYGVDLVECVQLMEETNKGALVWSMIGTTESEIVSWNTVVIVNPLFSKTSDCFTKDSLVDILTEKLLKPLLDLNEKRSCEVEVAIVHDTDESSKTLDTYLEAGLENFWKRFYNTDIKFSQVK